MRPGAIVYVDRPRPLSAVLSDLVRLATSILDRPHSAIVEVETVAGLRAEIEAAIARPQERERLIDERTLWLCTALRKLATEVGRETRAEWRDLAEYLLPKVRAALAAALAQEAEPVTG